MPQMLRVSNAAACALVNQHIPALSPHHMALYPRLPYNRHLCELSVANVLHAAKLEDVTSANSQMLGQASQAAELACANMAILEAQLQEQRQVHSALSGWIVCLSGSLSVCLSMSPNWIAGQGICVACCHRRIPCVALTCLIRSVTHSDCSHADMKR